MQRLREDDHAQWGFECALVVQEARNGAQPTNGFTGKDCTHIHGLCPNHAVHATPVQNEVGFELIQTQVASTPVFQAELLAPMTKIATRNCDYFR